MNPAVNIKQEETTRVESAVGIVAIGRNEGERLRACLDSLAPTGRPVVYVDSDSTDQSVELARSKGAEVVELDMSVPFTAARARNAGYQRLIEVHPDIQFIQFIDGDCEIATGWIDAALEQFAADESTAAVIGHLQEKNPDHSQYNRLCALEWRSPAGRVSNYGGFGGISMIRRDVLEKLGGFNPEVIAGEDSELGVRMKLAGYEVDKIDHTMAHHDAEMTQFSQWWKRSVRAGHAIGQRAYLNGNTEAQDCVREQKSTWLWGGVVPLLIVLGLIPTKGLSLLLLGGYALLGYRIYTFRRNFGDSSSEALLYTKFNLLAKLANFIGLLKFHVNRWRGKYEIIEYKQPQSN